MQFSTLTRWTALPICICTFGIVTMAANPSTNPSTLSHAARPQWPQEVIDAFFVDAREHLVGPRPQRHQTSSSETSSSKSIGLNPQNRSLVWSQLIEGDTLETEVKRIALKLQADLKSFGVFQSGGFQQCQRDFSMLAVLFAVIHQFDQDVRWRQDAAAWRDQFARCGFRCKEAGEETFAEAKMLHDQLVDLLRGNRHRLDKPRALAGGDQVADRSVLMRCMKELLREQISPYLGNKSTFRHHAAAVEHDAQLLAMLAEWIGHEGYEYWDEDSYAHQAHQLRTAATDLAIASRQQDYGQVRQAAGRVGQACSNCHEDYR